MSKKDLISLPEDIQEISKLKSHIENVTDFVVWLCEIKLGATVSELQHEYDNREDLNNNGWVKITDNQSLPSEIGIYVFRRYDGINVKIGYNSMHIEFVKKHYTHWREVEELTIPDPKF